MQERNSNGQFTKGSVAFWKGKKFTEAYKKKLSMVHKKLVSQGKNVPPSRRGISPSNKGKSWSDEVRKKISVSRKGKHSGENHWNWKGGITHFPYSVDWNKTLRISIRERDKYTCQLCREKQGDYAFDIHHIDYDKKNCNPENLVTLCRSCHAKTNNDRSYWIDYFHARR